MLFNDLLFEETINDSQSAFSDFLGPIQIPAAIKTFKFRLMLVIGRHMFESRHIATARIPALMSGHSFAVFVENLDILPDIARLPPKRHIVHCLFAVFTGFAKQADKCWLEYTEDCCKQYEDP